MIQGYFQTCYEHSTSTGATQAFKAFFKAAGINVSFIFPLNNTGWISTFFKLNPQGSEINRDLTVNENSSSYDLVSKKWDS